MSNTNNATITEKELWALFVEHMMKRTLSMGPTVEQYKPDDLLRDPGNYGDTEDLGDRLANELLESDMPGGELRRWVDELKNYLANVEMVSSDFDRLKGSLRIGDDDDDEEEYRYQRPTIDGEEAA